MADPQRPSPADDRTAAVTTRFAPSPNGPLHLGHAYAAIVAHDLAQEAGGRFLLRIEDIDCARSRPELADAFRRDLEWLGLQWEEVAPQSARLDAYEDAARELRAMGLLYPCRCTRADIAAASPRMTAEGPIYPGTCKYRAIEDTGSLAWRLDVDAALEITGPLSWDDALAGTQMADPAQLGDVVLVRKSDPASYHLAATLDDAADGVSLVTRGRDLFTASHVHRLLQELLGLAVPRWHHHPLIIDSEGRKLAKRRGSASLADMRDAGALGAKIATDLRLQRLSGEISLL